MPHVLFPILIVALLAVLWFLYAQGHAVIQSKRAVLYLERRRGREAKFSSCTGFTRRVLPLEEKRAYHVRLDCSLSSGDLSVEIQDRQKRPVVSLSCLSPIATFTAEKQRYWLVVRYEGASGNYSLSID